jgi:hypothetical protein
MGPASPTVPISVSTTNGVSSELFFFYLYSSTCCCIHLPSRLSPTLSTDNPGFAQSGPLGGQVQNVQFQIVERIPATAGKTITVTFTTQTPLASGDVASIVFPLFFIDPIGSASPTIVAQSPASSFSTVSRNTVPAGVEFALAITSSLPRNTFSVTMYVFSVL